MASGDNVKRVASLSIGLLLANFLVALIVDQFGYPLHPNVIASGALLMATVTNKLVSKYFA